MPRRADPRRRPAARLKLALAASAVALTVALVFAATSCHGHVVRREHLPPGAADFDFKHPPCAPRPRPAAGADDVLVRYLGVSGLYLRYRGVALLTAPFFSNYGEWRVAFGSVGADAAAIERGMAGLPDTRIRAVLVGHAHYDHLGDLPQILRDHAPDAEVYLNRSGKNMLEGAPGIANAFIDVASSAGSWIRLHDPDGSALPVRIMPLESAHAPQTRLFRFAEGEVQDRWQGLTGRKLRGMLGGRTYAYLIDFLNDDDSVAFRVHYQDAASPPPQGFPPAGTADERPVDLAVVCMPSYWLAPGYPVALLGSLQARHVLLSHYEDFLRPASRPLRFAPLLTNGRANRLIGMVSDALAGRAAVRPSSQVCGPAAEAWTMPLPGEWLIFGTEAHATGGTGAKSG